jgi:uncharacterized protein
MIRMNYQTKSQKDNMIISKLNSSLFLNYLFVFFIQIGFCIHTRKPTFQTSVYDYAKVLSASEKHS